MSSSYEMEDQEYICKHGQVKIINTFVIDDGDKDDQNERVQVAQPKI